MKSQVNPSKDQVDPATYSLTQALAIMKISPEWFYRLEDKHRAPRRVRNGHGRRSVITGEELALWMETRRQDRIRTYNPYLAAPLRPWSWVPEIERAVGALAIMAGADNQPAAGA